jgi:hypothetical protein
MLTCPRVQHPLGAPQIFKPFMMKQKGARKTQLYDLDGPSRSDAPRASWAASGEGTSDWMLTHEGPLLAQQQEGLQDARRPEADTTAAQVKKAEALSLAHWRKLHPAKKHWVGVKAPHHAAAVRKPARGVHAPDSILAKARARKFRVAKIKAQRAKVAAAKLAAAKRAQFDHAQDQSIIFSTRPKPHASQVARAVGATQPAPKRASAHRAAHSDAHQHTGAGAQERASAASKEAGSKEMLSAKSQEDSAKYQRELAQASKKAHANHDSQAATARLDFHKKQQPAFKKYFNEYSRKSKAVEGRTEEQAEAKASGGSTQQLHMEAAQKVPSWITDPWQPVRASPQ